MVVAVGPVAAGKEVRQVVFLSVVVGVLMVTIGLVVVVTFAVGAAVASVVASAGGAVSAGS